MPVISPSLRPSVFPSLHPGILIPLVFAAWLYLVGARALWQSAGRNHGLRHWQAGAFGLGWVTLVIALVSPLDHMGEELFSAHMAQHELLMAVAAPLLVLGRPLVVWLWALPIAWRRRLGAWAGAAPIRRSWGFLTLPVVAWIVQALAIWIWHMPRLFQATLSSEPVHALQHLSFLGSALLFWWSLLQIRDGRLGRPVAVLYLFTTAVHTSLLGAILTFSSRVWYPIYRATTTSWGLTPLEDQQLAGLIMWVPAGLAYLVAALTITATWLREPARRMAPARAAMRILP